MPFYGITADEIEQLGEAPFIDFMEKLIRAEAERAGINPLSIKITASHKRHTKDGGIDGRHIEAPIKESRWFPDTHAVWQFKAGELSPGKLKEEAKKSRVVEAVRNGATYCFAHGAEQSDSTRENRENAIREGLEEEGVEPRFMYLTPSDLANWSSEHPSLFYLPFFNRPVGDLMRFERWQSLKKHDIPFYHDETRAKSIELIQEVLRGDRPRIPLRIEGLPGVGKTRLAMEAVRIPGLDENVLYASTPEDLEKGFFNWLQDKPEANLVLIIDECSMKQSRRLIDKVEGCGDRVHLITIGSGKPSQIYESEGGIFFIHPLPSTVMKDLLEKVTDNVLPPHAIDWIVKASEGYVKLATRLAENMLKRPGEVEASKLAKTPGVAEILEQLVPDSEKRRIMGCFSLLSRVGWDEEYEWEGVLVAEFFNINMDEFRMIVQEMEDEGLVSRKGRFRYTTPHLLAVWLASFIWNSLGAKRLAEFYCRLIFPEVREAFWQRLSDLGDNEAARSFVDEVLSQFKELSDINNEEISKLINKISGSYPVEALQTLERLLGHLPRDNLLGLTSGRRHVVWALEKLAWRRDTFHGAARILLSLAEAENESYGNNATNRWSNLFMVLLGPTEVPIFERYIHIKEALQCESKNKQLLAVRAIGKAISGHDSRTGGGEHQGGRIVASHWQPKTPEELLQAKREALELFDLALNIPDQEIMDTSIDMFLQEAFDLIPYLPEEVLKRAFELPSDTEYRRRRIRDTLEFLVTSNDFESLTSEQKEQVHNMIATLQGTTFHDHFRRWIGPWSYADTEASFNKTSYDPDDEVKKLADEAIQDPKLLKPELDWIFSTEAEHIGLFVRHLGSLDDELKFFDLLLNNYLSIRRSPIPLTAYLLGRSDAGQDEWGEKILDRWAKENPEMSEVVLDATWRRPATRRAAERLMDMVDRKYLLPKDLTLLVWGVWTKTLESDPLKEIIQRLIQDGSNRCIEAALSIVDHRIRVNEKEREEFSDLAWELLRLTPRREISHMRDHHWGRIARVYLEDDPLRIAQIILDKAMEPETKFFVKDEFIKVLGEAARVSPEEIWGMIGEVLKSRNDDRQSFCLYMELRRTFYVNIPEDVLLQWAEKNMPEGPRVIAAITHPGGAKLNPLARELLVRYGDDDEVGDLLYSNVFGSSVVGSMAKWDERMRDTAEGWAKDSDPNVSAWAKKVANAFDKYRLRNKQREEEEWI